MGAMAGVLEGVACCGNRHNQEYHGMSPAIEPMRQPFGNDTWVADSRGAPDLAGLGSAEAPPEESLPSIDILGLSISPSTRNTRSLNRTSSPTLAPKDIKRGACPFSARCIPSPLFNAASSQLAASPLRGASLPPPSFPLGECLVDTGSPRGSDEDLQLRRMASSPAFGEIALSPRSVRTESCGDEEMLQTNTEASHEALSGPWTWPGTVAVGPGITLGAKCRTPAEQSLASLSAEPVIAG